MEDREFRPVKVLAKGEGFILGVLSGLLSIFLGMMMYISISMFNSTHEQAMNTKKEMNIKAVSRAQYFEKQLYNVYSLSELNKFDTLYYEYVSALKEKIYSDDTNIILRKFVENYENKNKELGK